MMRKLIEKHTRAMLAGAIALVVVVILLLILGKPPQPPNPGPLPDYVQRLETITIKLPGGVLLEMVRIPSGTFQMG